MGKIISKKDEDFFENVEYFSEIIDRINDIQVDNNFSHFFNSLQLFKINL